MCAVSRSSVVLWIFVFYFSRNYCFLKSLKFFRRNWFCYVVLDDCWLFFFLFRRFGSLRSFFGRGFRSVFEVWKRNVFFFRFFWWVFDRYYYYGLFFSFRRCCFVIASLTGDERLCGKY